MRVHIYKEVKGRTTILFRPNPHSGQPLTLLNGLRRSDIGEAVRKKLGVPSLEQLPFDDLA